MAVDLTGIDNVNEFFSQHYLDELLVKDLKDLRKEWKGGDDKSPPERLRARARAFTKALNEAAKLSRPADLYDVAHPVQVSIAEALGYPYQRGAVFELDDGEALPCIHRVDRKGVDQKGEPYLLVVEGRFTAEAEGALDVGLAAAQQVDDALALPKDSLSKLLGRAFAQERHPRWIVVLAGKEAYLAERARWGRGRHLRFDFTELFGRKDKNALAITAALLGKGALAPDDGAPLHDTLDENSHKHAYGVSSDLKYAARKAVELLGNEWVHYQRTIGKQALYGEHVSRELTEECLIYLYRLLFLFYAEARAAELRSLPMNSEEYRQGYSLEALRDLEMVPLNTPAARDGFFLHESLSTLFALVNEGHQLPKQEALAFEQYEPGFEIDGVHSPLFDPRLTPRLSRTKLRNSVVQEILQLLSLSREGRRGRGNRAWGRGRISYAQLGINQLGAVYEGLLSYTGFFANETLYEVHKAGAKVDETDQAFFVPESELDRYAEEELAFEGEDGQPARRRYDPGTFIFRLAGRDRETSASYYTPEVLTDCLVKYALKELLDGGMEPDPARPPLEADAILDLTVCEPAMGSGAFLVEAIDQLADAYLQRKQKELGEILEPERYALEKQKVATHIAAHNCYGVDLNPMAARLAGVSLWLATMHQGQEAPWFGARLAVGNSLVGARLAVWHADDLKTDDGLKKELTKVLKKHGGRGDLEEAVEAVLQVAKGAGDAREAVRRVFADAKKQWAIEDEEREGDPPTEERRQQLAKDLKKAIGDFKLPRHHRKPPEQLEAAKVVAGERDPQTVYHFLLPDAGMSPFDKDKAVKELVPDDVERLKAWRKTLTAKYGKDDVARLLRLSAKVDELYRRYVEDRRDVLRRCRARVEVWPNAGEGESLPISSRMKALDALKAEGMPYARLRAVMDLWAAQWAWPLRASEQLPSRDAWWSECERLLGVEMSELNSLERQLELMPETIPPPADEEAAVEAPDVVADVCSRLRPLHWELEFAEVFVDGGGFDLIVGNPPWIRLDWNEQGVLSDLEPRIALDGLSATETAKRRALVLSRVGPSRYLTGAENVLGIQAALGSVQSYPLLRGSRVNLYKCFITLGWRIGSTRGQVALVHQDGIFDDPKGGALRAALYPRLQHAYRFKNELMLFAEVDHQRPYCMTVTSAAPGERVALAQMSNLYHPKTVADSWTHDGVGEAPGIKDDQNRFETNGHASRLVWVGEPELRLFVSLFDSAGTPTLEARLPLVHSREVLSVLRKLAEHPRRLRDLGDVLGTMMWNETGGQDDGTIRRDTRVVERPSDLVLQGPHFYLCNPLNKSPREQCRHNQDYDVIDLETMSDAYVPRTNYLPACSRVEYLDRQPRLDGEPIEKRYRHVHREMVALTGERTMVPALIPPGVGHVHSVASIAASDIAGLVAWSALTASLPLDFLVRSRGSGHVQPSQAMGFPAPSGRTADWLASRHLRLNSLTTHYALLWDELWPQYRSAPAWTLDDPRLSAWPSPEIQWHRECALRNHFERRWALVEIDVLAAIELGLTIDELCTIYRTQFPVLREYEQNTWYDQNGRIVFTTNRGLPGVGHNRKTFEAWRGALDRGEPPPAEADTLRYLPPFETRDREADMRHAYQMVALQLEDGPET
ncbi:MAG: hypothetical protein RLP09_43235 [Sandaracinaceae bacterium]